MTQYVKVTLKEFEAMRLAVGSSHIQSGCWDCESQLNEIKKAVKATRAIEDRNNIEAHINWDWLT